jgi:hypothetical protein
MFLHLGEDVVVLSSSVVGIFDLDNTTISKDTRGFLKHMQEKNEVTDVSSELPKSFVLCAEGGKQRLYTSQISPATLLKRAQTL